jgi:pyrroline-5-carboxylate reductase
LTGIGVIGTGNMGAALVRGLVRSGKAPAAAIRVHDTDAAKTQALRDELGIQVAQRVTDVVTGDTSAVFLAVKPNMIAEVVPDIAHVLPEPAILISVAAGIPTSFILSCLGKPARVIRAMPNAAAMAGRSATALCKGGIADEGDLRVALDLFSALGTAVEVEEKLMNVVTALSGSGPGYLFLVMEALTDGAVRMGMDRPTARKLAAQTLIGAAAMVEAEPEVAFSELKDRITSPSGTTSAALHVFEREGLRGIIWDAVEAATKRGEELADRK